MTNAEFIKILQGLPAEATISYQDPNFGGVYEENDFLNYLSIGIDPKTGNILIPFPFESPVEW